MKKKEASWHFILPFMNFISTKELDTVEDLTEIEPISKKSILALTSIQQIDLFDLFSTKYIKYLLKARDSVEEEILSDEFCINFCILMESVGGNANIWDKYMKEIPREVKLELVHKGLYPLVYLEANTNTTVTRNKGLKFNSLSRYLLLKGFSGSKLSMS